MSGEKQIQDLYEFARELHGNQEILKSYRIFLLIEELAKPQYAKISISTKHVRAILELLIED